MCGIVGYIGYRNAYDVLTQGLHRLEYRGYDSAGVALVKNDGTMNVYKSTGKVNNMESVAADQDTTGGLGIAHTRWATHGEPNNVNAHPHVSRSGRLAIVHNGTIENYAILKKALTEHGYTFCSETDTEVLVQLIDYIQATNSCKLSEAVEEALKQVEGAYAIAVVEKDNPDTLIAVRKSSPLVIGIGDGETFIASDATPIVGYTDKVIYLKDNEMAVIRRNEQPEILSLTDDQPSQLNIQTLKMSVSQLEKGGYDTFMLKEIFEQPDTLRDCIRGRITDDCKRVVLSGVIENKERFIHANRIIFVACGTSWHAALIGKRVIQEMCHIPVEVEYASEFRYGFPYITDKDIVIAVSQSGETADTLAAIELARSKGAFVYGICNVVGASIPRNTDSGTYIHVGPEIGVASTKAFTGQVTVLTLLALCMGQIRGTVSQEKVIDIARHLKALPDMQQLFRDVKPRRQPHRLAELIKEIHKEQIRQVWQKIFFEFVLHRSTLRSLVLTFSPRSCSLCCVLDCSCAFSSLRRMEGAFSRLRFLAENSRKAAVITSASRPLKNTRYRGSSSEVSFFNAKSRPYFFAVEEKARIF